MLRKSESGKSDFEIVVRVVGLVILVSLGMKCNSCVKDYNRKRFGWVEVPEDYPHDRFVPEKERFEGDYGYSEYKY